MRPVAFSHCPAVRGRPGERNKVPILADLFIEGDVASQRKQDGGGQILRNFMLGKGADK